MERSNPYQNPANNTNSSATNQPQSLNPGEGIISEVMNLPLSNQELKLKENKSPNLTLSGINMAVQMEVNSGKLLVVGSQIVVKIGKNVGTVENRGMENFIIIEIQNNGGTYSDCGMDSHISVRQNNPVNEQQWNHQGINHQAGPPGPKLELKPFTNSNNSSPQGLGPEVPKPKPVPGEAPLELPNNYKTEVGKRLERGITTFTKDIIELEKVDLAQAKKDLSIRYIVDGAQSKQDKEHDSKPDKLRPFCRVCAEYSGGSKGQLDCYLDCRGLHTYHLKCVEPWLLHTAKCPRCAGSVALVKIFHAPPTIHGTTDHKHDHYL
jgi:hypothetical protein